MPERQRKSLSDVIETPAELWKQDNVLRIESVPSTEQDQDAYAISPQLEPPMNAHTPIEIWDRQHKKSEEDHYLYERTIPESTVQNEENFLGRERTLLLQHQATIFALHSHAYPGYPPFPDPVYAAHFRELINQQSNMTLSGAVNYYGPFKHPPVWKRR